MPSPPPALLSAAAGAASRSATGFVAKAARGFQVLRIDGYSWTTTMPAGDRITSDKFVVGGRHWYVDYHPNGGNSGSDSISLFLRLHGSGYGAFHVGAQYKFSLLDLAGAAAYELPPLTSTFAYAGRTYVPNESPSSCHYNNPPDPEGTACGHIKFIGKEELERRREVLLRDDCLAIRCDVGVVQLDKLAVAPKEREDHRRYARGHDDSDGSDGEESSRRRRQPMDDAEFVRRSLAKNRGA